MARRPFQRVHVDYFLLRKDAMAAAAQVPARWAETVRVRLYGKGWAVQLHESGPYLGRDLDPETHSCPWCCNTAVATAEED